MGISPYPLGRQYGASAASNRAEQQQSGALGSMVPANFPYTSVGGNLHAYDASVVAAAAAGGYRREL